MPLLKKGEGAASRRILESEDLPERLSSPGCRRRERG